ncbi:MAG: AAA family ATPase [Actinophytocola sp.]|nr:AAA family ATPase [Actinophytocola sp.]
MALDALGAYLCGIYPNGDLTHDPQEDNDPCVVIELRVGSDLEPEWLAHRPGDEESVPVKASLRAKFGTYRIDERVDAHLRWSRMSALGKLTQVRHGTKQTLTEANRAARKAVAEKVSPELAKLASEVQVQMEKIGSADFIELKPGLDLSLTNAQGNLALFDGPVPLMNFGLGTRRLAGAAAQRLANPGTALLLVDEVEYGLEPHRLVHLLWELRKEGAYAQVFVTTHSPTALQHLDAADLVMVRSAGGVTTMRPLDDPANLQSLLRGSPEAFLSRRIIVTEGKTEYGLVLGFLERWNDALPEGTAPSSALGVVAVEGNGGTRSATMASTLLEVGYEVTLLLDSDDPQANEKVPGVQAEGGVVVQWTDGNNTESAVCAELDVDGLTDFLSLAIDSADDPEAAEKSYLDQLVCAGAPKTPEPREVSSWLSADLDLEAARNIIATRAHEKSWFKMVAKGKALAKFILTSDHLAAGAVAGKLDELRAAIYEPRPVAEVAMVVPEVAAGADGD